MLPYTREELPFFPEVEASIRTIAVDNRIPLTDTVNRAMQALGIVDVYMLAGESILYMPTDDECQEINFETIGDGIDMDVNPIMRTVNLIDKASNSFRAYTETRGVPKEVAVMHGAFFLNLITRGQLAVRSSDRDVHCIRIV